MIGVSDESRHKVLRWLERCKLQLVAYIPAEDRAELDGLVAELGNAEPSIVLTRGEARLIVDDIIPTAIDGDGQYGGGTSEVEALYAPLAEKLKAFLLSAPVGCVPIYPCPKCGKYNAVSLRIPFVWHCACGHHFGVDYGTSKTGKRCWVYRDVIDLRTEKPKNDPAPANYGAMQGYGRCSCCYYLYHDCKAGSPCEKCRHLFPGKSGDNWRPAKEATA